MNTATSSHWWLGRFAARLLELNPQASTPSAVRRAVANYHRASHLQPDQAADLFYRSAKRSAAAGLRV